MNVVTVLPITNNRQDGELKYFSSLPVSVGSIVTIPIRNKETLGIVKQVDSASLLKSDLRNLDYRLKKLSRINSENIFPAHILKSAESIAQYYATGTGSILHQAIDKNIFEAKWQGQDISAKNHRIIPEVYAIQGDEDDRISFWRTIIRQEFAKKKSLIFFVPTSEEAKRLYSYISKGVEDFAYLLDNSDSGRNFKMKWKNIEENLHPIMIVATPTYNLIPRNDISTVIIERENHQNWTLDRTPYIDMRIYLEKCTVDQDRTLYIADKCLSVNTLYRTELHDIQTGPLFKWRLVSKAQDILIDMKEVTNDQKREEYSIISRELDEMILRNKNENGLLFLYTLRKGLSTITVCNDCGTVFTCPECDAPLILHRDEKNQRNFYLCHKCGHKAHAHDVCKKCLGTNIALLGIGLETVEEEIRKKHPSMEIFILDPDKLKTEKMKENILNQFMSKPGSILIGTESALSRISQEIDFSAIVSLDSLFSVPDYHISERIMYILTKMRSITRNTFIIQTRQIRERIFEYGRKGNLSDYYKNVINDRKTTNFPPFSTLIKFTIRGNKEKISNKMSELTALVSPNEIDVFPVFTKENKGRFAIHGLMKLPRGYWPNSELTTKLMGLDRDVEIKVNPENLL